MLQNLPRTTSTLIFISALMAASTAHALEGRALFDKFLAQPEMAKNKISWGTLTEQSADSFALTDVKIVNERNGEMNIRTLAVQGLQEAGTNRVAFDSLAVSGISGTTKNKGTYSISGFAAGAANFPVGIWKNGLTAEEKKQRVQFGNLSISGMEVNDKKGGFTLDVIAMNGADIPLDWRYDPTETYDGEPTAPMVFDIFSMSGFKASGNGAVVTLESAAIKDANIPTSQIAGANVWMDVVDSMSINRVNVSLGDDSVFSMDTLLVKIDDAQADGTIASKSVIDGIVVNLKAIPDPKTKAFVQQLGYDELRATMSGEGSYNPRTGYITATNTIMKFQDMFDLSMNYTMTGYTAEIAQKLAIAQQTIAQGVPPQQAFLSILPELSQIKLEGLKLALTDRSLTGKLLDIQAKQMGTTGDQLAQGAPMMIGLGMGGLGMPEFTEMVTQAIGTFLQNKNTLTVEAVPAEPVAIVDVVLKGQADPTIVPKLLNLQISAN